MPLTSNGQIEYVDLGLPSGTLWANMNVGATQESDSGFYYQWGDTEPAKPISPGKTTNGVTALSST